ncbi:MAG TPA: sugar phosphate isomerase/epimerase [Pirellulales bacterium]|nr:sugar phosphate isomerase/epimerase [Pirellulales bacterium]
MFKNLSPKALGLSGSQSELIESALSFGFRGLGLDVMEYVAQVKSHGAAHARRLLDSAKLQVGEFELPTRWQGDETTFRADLAQLNEWATVAAEGGFRRALSWLEPANDEQPFHQRFETIRKRLAELAKALEPHGMRLGVGLITAPEARQGKAFEFIHTTDALLLLLSSVPAKNVGAIVDLWDLHVTGSSLEALKKLGGERLIAARLADAPADVPAGELKASQRMLPGEGGALDSSAALVALAEMGFDGPVTPAAHPDQLKGLRREASIKRAGQALDKVWKAAGLSPAGKLASQPARR